MLILAWITVWVGHCFCSYRRMTKEPWFSETYSVVQVIEFSSYNITIELKHAKMNVWDDLCFYSYRRTTKEPWYCETYSVKQVTVTWWVSLYTITAQLKHVNPAWIYVWDDLCFYLYRSATKESCFGKIHSMEHVIETWWVSLYTVTAQLKQ